MRRVYRLTENEEILVIEIATMCRIADPSTAYDIIQQKIKELNGKGVYIDPKRTPLLIEAAEKLKKRKGAPAGMRFTFYTSSKSLY